MAGTNKVKRTVGELQDVEVVRLSLVDRGAIRVPFRMMKQEDAGVLDIDAIFKRTKADAGTIAVAAVAVAKDAPEGVHETVKEAGFEVGDARESNGDKVYLQVPEADFDVAKCQKVRAGEGVHAFVTGAASVLEKAEAAFALGEDKWIPGLGAASDALLARLDEAVEKGEAIPEAVKSAVEDFYAFASRVATLPAGVLKLEALVGVVEEAAKAEPAVKSDPEPKADPELKADPAPKADAEPVEPAVKSDPEPAKPDGDVKKGDEPASVAEQVAALLAPRFEAIERGVEAAKADAAVAKAEAEAARGDKGGASLPADPGDPEPLKLRGQPEPRAKRAVPLLDTARDRVED